MRYVMSSKRPLNLSLQPEIIEWLDKIMADRHYSSRSVLVEELIRERYDEVFGKGPKSSSASPYPTARAEHVRLEDRPAKKPKP